MKEKIYRNMCLVALLAVILTTAVATLVYYGNLERQTRRELAAEAHYLEVGIEQSGRDYLEKLSGEAVGANSGTGGAGGFLHNRVTLVAADGTVLYDNYAAADTMENHAGRQEIRQAMDMGDGSDSRMSDTLSEQTFYYALRLGDGTVIRVAATTASVWAHIAGMAPALCLAVAVICGLSMILAGRQTQSIVRPINEIDLSHPEEAKTYDELAPLLRRIERQQNTIRSQMEELITRQKEFTAITENMSEGFIVVGKDGEAVSYNTSALRLLGVKLGEHGQTAEPGYGGEKNRWEEDARYGEGGIRHGENAARYEGNDAIYGENGARYGGNDARYGENGIRYGECGTRLDILQFNRSRIFQTAVQEALAGRHNEQSMELSGRIYQVIANPVQGHGGYDERKDDVDRDGGNSRDGGQESSGRGGGNPGEGRDGSGNPGEGNSRDGGQESGEGEGRNKVTGAVLVILDVTEKQNREALRREFTANVSHELKTPLTSISGYAEIMKNGLVRPDDMRRFSESIYKEAQRMIALVGDILRLSQLDEGRIEEKQELVDLYELSGDIILRLKDQAEAAKVSLRLEGFSQRVLGTRQVLDEMIFNLCDNGIKYNNPGGHVTVAVFSRDGHPCVRVEDDGIGIPAADRERVFERFYRVDKSRSRQIGGTGLGLSIVKHGAMFHGAQVKMESEEGSGTKVEILFVNS